MTPNKFMENTLNNNAPANQSTSSDLLALLQQYFVITEKLNTTNSAAELIKYSKSLNEKNISIAIYGLIDNNDINILIGFDVLTKSKFPILFPIVISAIGKNEKPYYLYNNEKTILSDDYIKLNQLSDEHTLNLFIDNDWLRDKSIILKIRKFPDQITESQKEIYQLFSDIDLAIFMTDGLSPLTRIDVHYIREYAKKQLPYIMGVSRLELLTEEERIGVVNYVNEYISRNFQNFFILENHLTNGITLIESIESGIDKVLQSFNIQQHRMRFLKNWFIYNLYNTKDFLLARINVLNQQIEEIKKEGVIKKMELSYRDDHWLRIENTLTEKRQKIEHELKSDLSLSRDQIIENLLFEIGKSTDAKTSWERDLPFYINKELKNITEIYSVLLEKKILECLQWLIDEVSREFDFKFFISQKVNVGKEEIRYVPKQLTLTNIQKLMVKSKYGNAVAILGAAAIFVSGPVGGLVFASSMVYQAAVDQYITSKTKKEKLQISIELNKVMETLELKLVQEFSSRLKNNFDHIISILKSSRSEWLATRTEDVQYKTTDLLQVADVSTLEDMLMQVEKLLEELV